MAGFLFNREAEIAWDYLLLVSVLLILEKYKIVEGVLDVDESDCMRSKRIHNGAFRRVYFVAIPSLTMIFQQW